MYGSAKRIYLHKKITKNAALHFEGHFYFLWSACMRVYGCFV